MSGEPERIVIVEKGPNSFQSCMGCLGSTLIAFFVLIAISGSLSSGSPDTEELEQSEVSSPTLEPSFDPSAEHAAVDELESWGSIIEVFHDESRRAQWIVGVIDDGTRRYALAETVCMELRERGLQHNWTWVRVVDRPAVMSNGGDFRAASLGSVRCETTEWMYP